jgi:hypothetical protein
LFFFFFLTTKKKKKDEKKKKKKKRVFILNIAEMAATRTDPAVIQNLSFINFSFFFFFSKERCVISQSDGDESRSAAL